MKMKESVVEIIKQKIIKTDEVLKIVAEKNTALLKFKECYQGILNKYKQKELQHEQSLKKLTNIESLYNNLAIQYSKLQNDHSEIESKISDKYNERFKNEQSLHHDLAEITKNAERYLEDKLRLELEVQNLKEELEVIKISKSKNSEKSSRKKQQKGDILLETEIIENALSGVGDKDIYLVEDSISVISKRDCTTQTSTSVKDVASNTPTVKYGDISIQTSTLIFENLNLSEVDETVSTSLNVFNDSLKIKLNTSKEQLSELHGKLNDPDLLGYSVVEGLLSEIPSILGDPSGNFIPSDDLLTKIFSEVGSISNMVENLCSPLKDSDDEESIFDPKTNKAGTSYLNSNDINLTEHFFDILEIKPVSKLPKSVQTDHFLIEDNQFKQIEKSVQTEGTPILKDIKSTQTENVIIKNISVLKDSYTQTISNNSCSIEVHNKNVYSQTEPVMHNNKLPQEQSTSKSTHSDHECCKCMSEIGNKVTGIMDTHANKFHSLYKENLQNEKFRLTKLLKLLNLKLSMNYKGPTLRNKKRQKILRKKLVNEVVEVLKPELEQLTRRFDNLEERFDSSLKSQEDPGTPLSSLEYELRSIDSGFMNSDNDTSEIDFRLNDLSNFSGSGFHDSSTSQPVNGNTKLDNDTIFSKISVLNKKRPEEPPHQILKKRNSLLASENIRKAKRTKIDLLISDSETDTEVENTHIRKSLQRNCKTRKASKLKKQKMDLEQFIQVHPHSTLRNDKLIDKLIDQESYDSFVSAANDAQENNEVPTINTAQIKEVCTSHHRYNLRRKSTESAVSKMLENSRTRKRGLEIETLVNVSSQDSKTVTSQSNNTTRRQSLRNINSASLTDMCLEISKASSTCKIPKANNIVLCNEQSEHVTPLDSICGSTKSDGNILPKTKSTSLCTVIKKLSKPIARAEIKSSYKRSSALKHMNSIKSPESSMGNESFSMPNPKNQLGISLVRSNIDTSAIHRKESILQETLSIENPIQRNVHNLNEPAKNVSSTCIETIESNSKKRNGDISELPIVADNNSLPNCEDFDAMYEPNLRPASFSRPDEDILPITYPSTSKEMIMNQNVKLNNKHIWTLDRTEEKEEIIYEKPIFVPKKNIKISWKAAKTVLIKVVNFPTDDEVIQNACNMLKSKSFEILAGFILRVIIMDKQEPESGVDPFQPHLSKVAKTMLGLIVKLEREAETCGQLTDEFLIKCEHRLLTLQESEIYMVEPLARMYVAICKYRNEPARLRRLIWDALYFIGKLAVPFAFAALTGWMEILPREPNMTNRPLLRVLNNFLSTVECKQASYNLLPLKNLFKYYYKFPEYEFVDGLLKDFTKDYLCTLGKNYELAILILCKISSDKKRVVKHIQLLQELTPVMKDQESAAALVHLVSHITAQFPTETDLINSVNVWLGSLKIGLSQFHLESAVKQAQRIILKR